jgi:cold shock CspA family protein
VALQARKVTEAPKSRATVIWYNRDKGHGFLKVEGYPHDLYVHASQVRIAGIAPDALLKDTALLCNVGTFKDRPCAQGLELLPAE